MNPAERERLERQMRDGAMEGLRAAGHLIAERAISHMPVGDPAEDPDPATSLAERTRVEDDGDSVLVIVDTPYGQVQHWANYAHPRGGEDRFLERAVLETAPELPGIVANSTRSFRGRT